MRLESIRQSSLDDMVAAFESNQEKVMVNSEGFASYNDDQFSYNY